MDHSCETVWNKHNSSYYSKQNTVLLQGKSIALSTTNIWISESGNEKQQIKRQTIQWIKENRQKDKQWFTKHYLEN